MKSIQLFIIISLTIALSTKAVGQITNDRIDAKLKGEVKSIKEIIYKAYDSSGHIKRLDTIKNTLDKYDIKGNCIARNRFYSNANPIQLELYEYNSFGYKIKGYRYDPFLNKKYNLYFNYDNKWNLIEKSYYLDSVFDYNEIFKYDSKGLLIERCKYNNDKLLESKDKYKYNNKDLIIEIKRFQSNNEMGPLQTYKYDHNGNIIEWSIIYQDSTINSRLTFKYDRKGNKIEENDYRKSKYESKFTTKFDSNGNPFERTCYLDGRIQDQLTIQYKYDLKNNWILRLQYENKNLHSISERLIEYFE